MPWRSSRARPSASISARPVGAQHEIAAPAGQLERQSRARARRGRRSPAADRALPSRRSTDSGTRSCRTARGSPGISGRLSTTPVAMSSLRDVMRRAVGERDVEARVAALGRRDLDVAQLDGVVLPQLLARDARGTRAAACRRARGSRASRATRRCAAGRCRTRARGAGSGRASAPRSVPRVRRR